jgi:hypothetical protein
MRTLESASSATVSLDGVYTLREEAYRLFVPVRVHAVSGPLMSKAMGDRPSIL